MLSVTRARWLALDCTTPDVKANCDDLKVLGKGDFKALLKWRLALREEVHRLFLIRCNILIHLSVLVGSGCEIKGHRGRNGSGGDH